MSTSGGAPPRAPVPCCSRGGPSPTGRSPRPHHSMVLRQAIDAITQCVLVLGGGRLRIAKAEGRPPGVQGSVFRVQPNGAHAELEGAPTAARLGAALRAIRIQRHLSQAELAELARVSASAISQAERGRRGLALDTLLQLTSRSSMTIDELLRGEIARVPARAPPRLGASRRGAVPAARRSARRPARPAVAPLARPEHARGHAAHRRRARRGGGRPGPGHPADRPARAAAGRGAAGRAQRGERLAERGENDVLIFWILRDEAVPAPMQ
jgi:transcriptional regulator with XRE-family HTH domain